MSLDEEHRNPSTAVAPSAVDRAPTSKCGTGDDPFQALKLTKFVGSIREDYVVVASGERTWTNMKTQLLRQFRVRVGAAYCMKHATQPAEGVDVD